MQPRYCRRGKARLSCASGYRARCRGDDGQQLWEKGRCSLATGDGQSVQKVDGPCSLGIAPPLSLLVVVVAPPQLRRLLASSATIKQLQTCATNSTSSDPGASFDGTSQVSFCCAAISTPPTLTAPALSEPALLTRPHLTLPFSIRCERLPVACSRIADRAHSRDLIVAAESPGARDRTERGHGVTGRLGFSSTSVLLSST
jgi:hypothetical protein